MSFSLWSFLMLFMMLLVPLSWSIAHAVGMELITWKRAVAFSLLEGVVGCLSMWALPFDYFILKVLAGVFGSLLFSPLAFRVVMTDVPVRAMLGSFLLVAVSVSGVVLFVIF